MVRRLPLSSCSVSASWRRVAPEPRRRLELPAMFRRPAGVAVRAPNDGGPPAAESPYWSLPDAPGAERDHAVAPGIATSSAPGAGTGPEARGPLAFFRRWSSKEGYQDLPSGSAGDAFNPDASTAPEGKNLLGFLRRSKEGLQPAPSGSAGDASNADVSAAPEGKDPLGFVRRSREGYHGVSAGGEQGSAAPSSAGTAPPRPSSTAPLPVALQDGAVSQRCWVANKLDTLTRAPQPAGLGLEPKLRESLLERAPPRQPLQDLQSFLDLSVPGFGRSACSQDVYQFLADEAPTEGRDASHAHAASWQPERLAPEPPAWAAPKASSPDA